MIQNGTYNVEFWQSWGRIPISVSGSCRGGGGGAEAAGDGKSQAQ